MNRQMRRRANRNLNLNNQELDNIAEHFRRENEEANRQLVMKFMSLTVEALRQEFGFGQKRIERYGDRVDSLLDCINLEFVTFEDFLDEMSIKPSEVIRLSKNKEQEIKKKTQELKSK